MSSTSLPSSLLHHIPLAIFILYTRSFNNNSDNSNSSTTSIMADLGIRFFSLFVFTFLLSKSCFRVRIFNYVSPLPTSPSPLFNVGMCVSLGGPFSSECNTFSGLLVISTHTNAFNFRLLGATIHHCTNTLPIESFTHARTILGPIIVLFTYFVHLLNPFPPSMPSLGRIGFSSTLSPRPKDQCGTPTTATVNTP